MPRKRLSKELKFSLILTGIFVLFSAVLLPEHEPWADEAHVWLVARDLSPLQIIQQMSFDGTPALWDFVVFPFAHFGAPYIWMQIIHLVIAAIAVFVFVRYAPFSKLFKILLIFSYWISHEYSIISRNYAITLLALFGVAALYKNRLEKPLLYSFIVAILANTSLQGLFFAAGIGALFFFDAVQAKKLRNSVPGLIIMIIAGLASAYQVYPNAESFHVVAELNWNRAFEMIEGAFPFHSIFPYPSSKYLATSTFCLIALTLLKKPRALFFLTTVYGSMLFIFVRIPIEMGLRHMGLLFFGTLFAMWISVYEESTKWKPLQWWPYDWLVSQKVRAVTVGIIQLLLLISFKEAYQYYFVDLHEPYSNSREMAMYIEQTIPSDVPIVAHNGWRTMALLPYLPDREFYFPSSQGFATFQILTAEYKRNERLYDHDVVTRELLMENIDREFPDNRPILLLSIPLSDPESLGYLFVKEYSYLPLQVHAEMYFLYVPKQEE